MAERNSGLSLMDQWDNHEQKIAQIKDAADEGLRALLKRLSLWVDVQRDLSLKTEKGIERWATPGTTAFFYKTSDSNGMDTDLEVRMGIFERSNDDEDDAMSNCEQVVVEELRDRKATDRPIALRGKIWRFVSFTEFRYTDGSLETVDAMRGATNAVKHSTSTHEPYVLHGRVEDTYGYYEPARYGENAFVRRRHDNPLNRVDPLQEGNRILDLLYNARLVGRTVHPNRIQEPVEVINKS